MSIFFNRIKQLDIFLIILILMPSFLLFSLVSTIIQAVFEFNIHMSFVIVFSILFSISVNYLQKTTLFISGTSGTGSYCYGGESSF
jgi:hypothetical protein